MIEKGRHQNIDKSSRFCIFCPNSIEDEVHCLMICKCFMTHRDELFKTITENQIPNFVHAETLEKFKILMTNPNIIQYTAQHITKTMFIRDFLIAKHKNNT